MIFGTRSRIAVEFELNPDYGGIWLFGKFCLWVQEQQVGDYEMGVSLRDILILLESMVRDNGNRMHNELFLLAPNELYTKLNDALYGNSSHYDEIAMKEIWARFDVGFSIDIFNCWKIFLVENHEKARLVINKLDEEGGLYQIQLNKGEFDEIIFMAYQELGRIYDIEKAKSL